MRATERIPLCISEPVLCLSVKRFEMKLHRMFMFLGLRHPELILVKTWNFPFQA